MIYETIQEKQVLRIECDAATTPAYVKDNDEEIFYIRTGPATTKLKVSKIFEYIRMRFYDGEI